MSDPDMSRFCYYLQVNLQPWIVSLGFYRALQLWFHKKVHLVPSTLYLHLTNGMMEVRNPSVSDNEL